MKQNLSLLLCLVLLFGLLTGCAQTAETPAPSESLPVADASQMTEVEEVVQPWRTPRR